MMKTNLVINDLLFIHHCSFLAIFVAMERYINPLTDFGFKWLFGTEPNKELLVDFLNELLPEHHRIKTLTYARNEHLGVSVVDRKAIFDIYCESESGDKFIVEIQKANRIHDGQNYFEDRTVYYSTFPVQEQAKQGDWNFELSAVYTIGILDFVFDDHRQTPDLLHTVKLRDQNCQIFYDKLTYIYIELPKFKKKEAELNNHFDKCHRGAGYTYYDICQSYRTVLKPCRSVYLKNCFRLPKSPSSTNNSVYSIRKV